MGCTVSNYEDKESAARSKAIDRNLKLDRERKAREIKLLLLGKFLSFSQQFLQSNQTIIHYNLFFRRRRIRQKHHSQAAQVSSKVAISYSIICYLQPLFSNSNFRIIHIDGYDKEECRQFRRVIYANTIQSLSAILQAMELLGIGFALPESRELAHRYASLLEQSYSITPELAAIMKVLWLDGGVQACFRRAREYQLNDSAH